MSFKDKKVMIIWDSVIEKRLIVIGWDKALMKIKYLKIDFCILIIFIT